MICICGKYRTCPRNQQCEAQEPDGDDYEDMTIEQMNREESRYIDRENAREINRRIE